MLPLPSSMSPAPLAPPRLPDCGFLAPAGLLPEVFADTSLGSVHDGLIQGQASKQAGQQTAPPASLSRFAGPPTSAGLAAAAPTFLCCLAPGPLCSCSSK